MAYKFKLFPNKEQKEVNSKYFGYSILIRNKALGLRETQGVLII